MKEHLEESKPEFKPEPSSSPWSDSANKRFVSYFDILGFKESVLREDHEVLANRLVNYSHSLNVIRTSVGNNKRLSSNDLLRTYIFSDSIIMFSKDDTIDSFLAITAASQSFLASVLIDKTPIKGAMAYGKITVNEGANVFFGQPLIDAYQLEQEVKYFGLIIHNSIEKYIREQISEAEYMRTVGNIIFESEVQLERSKVVHKSLNWFSMLGTILEYEGKIKGKALFKVHVSQHIKDFRATCSGSARAYIDNTLKIFDDLYKND